MRGEERRVEKRDQRLCDWFGRSVGLATDNGAQDRTRFDRELIPCVRKASRRIDLREKLARKADPDSDSILITDVRHDALDDASEMKRNAIRRFGRPQSILAHLEPFVQLCELGGQRLRQQDFVEPPRSASHRLELRRIPIEEHACLATSPSKHRVRMPFEELPARTILGKGW